MSPHTENGDGSYPLSEDEAKQQLTLVASLLTFTGEIYRVARNGQNWWLSTEVLPSPEVPEPVSTAWWPIASPEPWPPRLDHPISLRAPADHDNYFVPIAPTNSPWTTPVRAVLEMTPSHAEAAV